jgi:alanine racemase
MSAETDHQSPSQFVQRPTHIEVDTAALRANFRAIKKLVAPAKVMASVKANGYGHGLVTVSRVLEEEGIDSLGVAYIEEALELRKAGIKTPLLVFGGLMQEQLELYINNDVEVTASSVSKLEQIEATAAKIGKRARVHLKVDTGLERIGVHHYSAQSLFDAALAVRKCDVVGVYSHFAEVNRDDLSLAKLQLERFLTAIRYFEDRAQAPFVRHIANSGGVLCMPESYLDMVRPGLCLYGVLPNPSLSGLLDLKPTLSLKSQIVYFKVVKQGAGVSYGHSWTAPHDTRVVTVPIGYGDGYLRGLSNKAHVLIGGKRRSVIGRVCMDQLMVDISPEGQGYNGDEVVLIGRQGGEEIKVEELAQLLDTTPHEVLVLLNQRVPRVSSF